MKERHEKQSNDKKENDMRKMYSSAVLGTDNPVFLQHRDYVDLAFHFCNRGLGYVKFYEKIDFFG